MHVCLHIEYRQLLSEHHPFQDKKHLILIAAINEVTLLGRVGADPQKRGSVEHPLVIFSLATHTNYKYESGTMITVIILILTMQYHVFLHKMKS